MKKDPGGVDFTAMLNAGIPNVFIAPAAPVQTLKS
jgi:hypothetical protein